MVGEILRSREVAVMSTLPAHLPSVSGHVRRVERRRGWVWYAKYRVPDTTAPRGVRQVEKLLGPEWPDEGAPPPGYYNRRKAQATLEAILTDARRGALEVIRTGVSFERAARDWLVWGQYERNWKAHTLADRRSCLERHLLPAFGPLRVEQVTTARIERWKSEWLAERGQRRQAAKLIALLNSIFERARRLHGLPRNPVEDVTKIKVPYDATRFDFYSAEEVYALARAAEDEHDAAIFLSAAFTGLGRGGVMALRWRDVDFPKRAIRVEGSVSYGEITTTKGGRGRVVPMVDDLAQVLARLGQRGFLTGREDPVFPGELGGYMDGSALRRRFVEARKRAGLRPLRFHDLRHTFGSLAITRATIVRVRAWMGHADSRTTMRYLHHKSQVNEAELLADAFRPATASEAAQTSLDVGDDGC